jgi:drug/metabolite transporter (DMT)-like permease
MTRIDNGSLLIMAVLLMVDSMHLVFARLLLPHLPPGTSAMWVITVATIEVGAFLAIRGQIQMSILRAHARFFLAVGVLVGGATVLNYTAIQYIDPGTASMLAQTATLFSLVFSLYWLREKLSGKELVGAVVAIAGVFTISFQAGEYLRLGSLFVLSSAFMYALHAAIVKRYGGDIDFANFFFFRVASTSLILLLIATARGQFEWPSTEGWLLVLLAGTVDVVFSRMLYYLALRRLRMSIHAVLLTLSPVVTILWSFLLFASWPSTQALIGGFGVISGVAIVTLGGGRKESRQTAPPAAP